VDAPRRLASRVDILVALLLFVVASACIGARALRGTGEGAPPPAPIPVATVATAATVATVEPPPPDVPRAAPESTTTTIEREEESPLDYAGRDALHRPRYVARAFSAEERELLRDAFGIADPGRLWLPDSSRDAVLRYDAPGGLSVRVGYRSLRRPGETWEAFVGRIRRQDRRAWPATARTSYHAGLASLAPAERAEFERLLDAARAAGFRVRVAETLRAPERQAWILAHGNGKTMTATSAHQYGRAADLIIGDGRIGRVATAREWIRFRRWVLAWGGGRFALVGSPTSTWDWPHVELVDPPVGFRSVDALLAAARRCLAAPAPADEDPCAIPRGPSSTVAAGGR
jgi:hypothetical protein